VAACAGAPEKLAPDTFGTTTPLVLDGPYLYWGTGFDLRRLRAKP
jgi:hypothetical protein